ncbi:glutathione S-transferase C-terminal domain-containing protein homolog [Cylas formicarius]|uniref:glutathione S-transferase C-terminal domain-containing protein homolog n=1 Tax=Cylas formicarius TaxID=197179 RepID=UPI0029588BE1|nr:glutathione S-transferase C-terminal domain-containing protein homolog [Cylas formicarius]
MACLYINIWHEVGKFFVNTRTFVILFLYRIVQPRDLQLKARLVNIKPVEPLIELCLSDYVLDILNDFPGVTNLCTWPVLVLDSYVISGMCSVARQVVKFADNENVRLWLGFRESCLVACAESSVWTKFCEIDMMKSVEDILASPRPDSNLVYLPENVVKYECHLAKPVRIHNIYKIARNEQNNQSLQSSVPKEHLKIYHNFSEGPYITLADAILYPCFELIARSIDFSKINSKIPHIIGWLDRLRLEHNFPKVNGECNLATDKIQIIVPSVTCGSLYKADFIRDNAEKHTKQYKIDDAFKLVEKIKNGIRNDVLSPGHSIKFNWNDIPLAANPKGGSLPQSRADRKCEQLESMAKAAMHIVSEKNYRIVDFCSGSGHLGILLAVLLPHCHIVLVENKERSLVRARETLSDLKLPNVTVVQSNLDYFVGTFDLGVALHACGVATDLVLQMCIRNKADFLCCPCCYGGIKQCHELTYPRSAAYQELFSGREYSYFDLAHAADQTHDKDNAKTEQGYRCMDIIDTDRKLHAESCGYEVSLGKLQPPSCTNKNNLLVGTFRK